MDCEPARGGGDLIRPPSIHSFRSALNSFPLPASPPPTKPPPPIPTRDSLPLTASRPDSRPPSRPASRPGTGSTRRVSFESIALRPTKPLKYGTGKHSRVELVPQPSDDADDPLNWPQWKKEANLASLLIMVGLTGAMKTAFVSTNGAMATHYGVSYAHIAALTAVPLMVSAVAAMASSVAAKVWGKRPAYLLSSALAFIGCIWNATAGNSYGSCMGARVMQGLGWGAFDTLLMETIQDTYYEHERNIRVSLYNILAITTTWGSPLIGGVISNSLGSFTVQYRIISALFAIALPLLALGSPETAFDRSKAAIAPTPASGVGAAPRPCQPQQAECKFDKAAIIDYIKDMKPWSFQGDRSPSTLIQTPRALAAPTTSLVFLLTFIPHCALWGLTASLGLLFTPSPINLDPNMIGTLMTGPWILACLLIAGLYIYRSVHQKFTPSVSNLTIAGGSLFAFAGLLAFGLSAYNFMLHAPSSSNDDALFIPKAADELCLPVISLQLGLLAAGSAALDATTRPLLARSASFTASSMAAAQRSVGDMYSCVVVLRNLLAGSFVLAVPHAVSMIGGLKVLVIGLAVAQAVFAGGIVALWWFCNEAIWRVDGKMMGLVDLRLLKLAGSFFDTD